MISDKANILERLKNDEDYYGEFGKQFLSNSNVSTLMENPLALGAEFKISPALVMGRYFHTSILEPEKIQDFKISEASSRNSKAYKELADGELILLQKEVDNLIAMEQKIMGNDVCNMLIEGDFENDGTVDYEVPMVKTIKGVNWKGKADILNHGEKLIVDLKTTGNIQAFRSSAYKYNYDSQAYIYRELFGYDMMFLAIDKTTHQIGIFECSEAFYDSGEEKVKKALVNYNLFFKNKEFDPKQHFARETL